MSEVEEALAMNILKGIVGHFMAFKRVRHNYVSFEIYAIIHDTLT